jgi:hypothetical protein
MRLAIVLFVVIGCPSLAFAQGKIDVRWEKNAGVRISQGKNVSRIDLREDIIGCLGELFDGSTKQRFGSGLRKTQVLDVVGSDGQHYVLLSAATAPNCNVQGRCGAGDNDVTLIWLQVGADLAVIRKQVFAAEDCIAARWIEGMPENWDSTLTLSAGSLTLSFTEDVYDRTADKLQEFTGQAVYDRRSASEGIRITRAPK